MVLYQKDITETIFHSKSKKSNSIITQKKIHIQTSKTHQHPTKHKSTPIRTHFANRRNRLANFPTRDAHPSRHFLLKTSYSPPGGEEASKVSWSVLLTSSLVPAFIFPRCPPPGRDLGIVHPLRQNNEMSF